MPVRNCRPLGATPPGGGLTDLNAGGGGGGAVVFPNDREIAPQSWCAVDAAGNKVADVIVGYQWDEDTGVFLSADLRNPDGTAFVTAYDHLEACDTGEAFQIDVHEMCDDINGDASVIVRYFEFAKIELDGVGNLIRTVTGTFDDDRQSNPYVPVNGVECETLGVPVIGLEPRRVVLDGVGVWTPPAGEILTSVTLEVRRIADVNTPPTLTDGAGATTDLYEGTETFEAEWLAGSGGLTGNPLTITSNAGDLVVVIFTVADV